MPLESLWTTPRADCPHPERWHAPDDESAEEEVAALVAGFVRALQPDLVVETGTAWGWTAIEIAYALQRNRHGRLVTLELDLERRTTAAARLRPFDQVEVIHGSSLEWTPELSERIGFLWLDSDLDLRTTELDHFAPFLGPGSVVGIHDAGPFHGYRDAYEAALARHGFRPLYLPTPRGVVFAEVPA